MPDNIGVGDVLQYQVGGAYHLAFVHGRTSSSVYTVASLTGGRRKAIRRIAQLNSFKRFSLFVRTLGTQPLQGSEHSGVHRAGLAE